MTTPATSRTESPTDDGFTLVEVILTVAMMGIVTAVIAAAIIVVIRSEDGVVSSTAESHDTRQVVSYLPLDVASGPSRADAYRASIGGEPGDTGSGCSEIGNDNVLRIEITDRRLDLVEKRLAYRLVTTPTKARLDRYVCRWDAPTSSWVEEELLNVADSLDPSASPIAEVEVSVSNPSAPIEDQEVTNIELRYVQRGDTESITASPREEQVLSTSGVCGTDPLEATRNIATFVQGNVELHGTDVKSSLFVGGTLTYHGGSVAQALPDLPVAPVPNTVGLLVGSIDWGSSTGELEVKPHWDVVIEDGNYLANGDEITESAPGTSPSIGIGASASVLPPGPDPLINPGEAFAELRACSDRLASLPNSCNNGACATFVGLPAGYSGTASDPGPQLKLELSSTLANAFNIDESNLADLETIQVGFAPGDQPDVNNPLIINVRSTVGGVVNFKAPDIQGSGSSSVYVVWNFPNADEINVLANNELRGTLLAPYARVTSQVSIQGGVVAREFEMFGSSLNDVRSFSGVLAW